MKARVEHRAIVDAERRITLPRGFREALSRERAGHVILRKGKHLSVMVYRPSAFQGLLSHLKPRKRGKSLAAADRLLLRGIFSSSLQAAIDSRGRIRLHRSLWSYFPQPRSIVLVIVV